MSRKKPAPLHPLRLDDPYEKAFRKEWEILQSGVRPFDILSGPSQDKTPESGIDFDICRLTGAVIPYPFGRMTKRDHLVAFEFAQWLGSPCGTAFIERSLQRVGARIQFNFDK